MVKLLKCPINITTICYLRRILFNTKHKNILIYLILFLIFTIEILTYYFATFKWNSINCSNLSNSKCTKILLVADPQLIGLQNEPLSWQTPFTIWDSDRYLSKTYSYAFHFTKPDVVIFLGDLFDEGSSGTDAEFKLYLRRLFNIFLRKPLNNAHHVWLPGDNDIGGEGMDRITAHKVKRFEHAFSQPDILKIKHVKFYKINRLLSQIPKFSNKNNFNNLDSIIVGVSHMPLLMAPAMFVDKVIEKLQPHVLFSAHTHNSMIISTQQEFRKDRLITPVRSDDNEIYEYNLGVSDLYEILVPTCSYRMGTSEIGYGFAVIENETIRYTVLWTPSRFLQLFFYVFVLMLGLTYLVVKWCCLCSKKDNTGRASGFHLIA